jgi:hypothetical protein
MSGPPTGRFEGSLIECAGQNHDPTIADGLISTVSTSELRERIDRTVQLIGCCADLHWNPSPPRGCRSRRRRPQILCVERELAGLRCRLPAPTARSPSVSHSKQDKASEWVRDQVETYERTRGQEANTFLDGETVDIDGAGEADRAHRVRHRSVPSCGMGDRRTVARPELRRPGARSLRRAGGRGGSRGDSTSPTAGH